MNMVTTGAALVLIGMLVASFGAFDLGWALLLLVAGVLTLLWGVVAQPARRALRGKHYNPEAEHMVRLGLRHRAIAALEDGRYMVRRASDGMYQHYCHTTGSELWSPREIAIKMDGTVHKSMLFYETRYIREDITFEKV